MGIRSDARTGGSARYPQLVPETTSTEVRGTGGRAIGAGSRAARHAFRSPGSLSLPPQPPAQMLRPSRPAPNPVGRSPTQRPGPLTCPDLPQLPAEHVNGPARRITEAPTRQRAGATSSPRPHPSVLPGRSSARTASIDTAEARPRTIIGMPGTAST